MKSKIEIPDELAHLIEKREQSDRRASAAKARAATKEADSLAKKTAERRKGGDRRSK